MALQKITTSRNGPSYYIEAAAATPSGAALAGSICLVTLAGSVAVWQNTTGLSGGWVKLDAQTGQGAVSSLFRLRALPRPTISGVTVPTDFTPSGIGELPNIPAGLLNTVGAQLRVRMAVSLNDQYSFTGGIKLGGTAIALFSTFTPTASNVAYSVAEATLQTVTTGTSGQFTISKWQITDGQGAAGGVPGVLQTAVAVSGTYDLTSALSVVAYGTPGNTALTVQLNEFSGMYIP